MNTQDYTVISTSDPRTQTLTFRWKPKAGKGFSVTVPQGAPPHVQKRSFSKQLYVHALRHAEAEFEGDGALPHQVALRADEILVELAGMINK